MVARIGEMKEATMEDSTKEYIATITSKGQVTIPVEVRQKLNLAPQDKLVFRIVEDNRVEIESLPMTLEEAYGSVDPITRPEDFDALRRVASEERDAQWLKKLKK